MADPPTRIRLAHFGDARAIAEVQVRTWLSAYRGIVDDGYLDAMSVDQRTARWDQILAKPEQVCYVASDNDEVIGFASGGSCAEPGFDGELYAIYILPEYHGRGIGKALTKAVLDELVARGMRTFCVWALTENRAIEFYKSLGATYVRSKDYGIGPNTHIAECYALPAPDGTT